MAMAAISGYSPEQRGGTPPVIDGKMAAEEWQGARRESFSDGSKLLLLRHGDDLFLGIQSKTPGLIAGNVLIDRGEDIAILHASAALGTAVYRKDGEAWRLIRDFSWRCRSVGDSETEKSEREAFLREEGWVASNSRMGTPQELEYRIRTVGGHFCLAVTFLRASDPNVKVPWPADLDDDCLRPTSGGLPPTLQFSPEKWATISSAQTDFPVLKGPYLGQKRPGITPEFFAPGILSLGFHEHNIAISPDGKEIFFVAASSDFSRYLIMTTRLKNGAWTMPEVAPFSGGRNDGAPSFSPDGKRLYFSSRRPRTADVTSADDFDIWFVERKNDSWTDPVNPGGPVNTGQNEANPSVMSDGTIYFQKIEKLGGLGWDLYVSRSRNGTYGPPEKLPAPVNTEANEAGPFIAADGSYLLFQSNRPGGYGIMDLYVACRTKSGGWSEPVNLGDQINSPLSDWGPVVSPDGKYLFFGSFRNIAPLAPESRDYFEYMTSRLGLPTPGKGTLYWMEAKVIDALRPKVRNMGFDRARDRIILEHDRRFGESLESKVLLAVIIATARGQVRDEYQKASVKEKISMEQLVDVEGRKLSCTVYGQGAPTVVLISGFNAEQSCWNPVIPELIDKATIVTYDRPGVGKSEKGNLPLHAEQSAKDLFSLLQKTDVPKPYIIVGHSIGAGIARLFTFMHPEDVGGLIFEDGVHESLLARI